MFCWPKLHQRCSKCAGGAQAGGRGPSAGGAHAGGRGPSALALACKISLAAPEARLASVHANGVGKISLAASEAPLASVHANGVGNGTLGNAPSTLPPFTAVRLGTGLSCKGGMGGMGKAG